MKRSVFAAAGVALVAHACFVAPKDYAGLDCDEAHACLDGRRCDPTLGVCVAADYDAGPRDAGQRDSGVDDGGCPSDAGSALLWSQCREGFASFRQGFEDAGFIVELDARHRIQATVFRSTLVGPVGVVTGDRVHPPRGRLRGKLTIPNAFSLSAPSIFVHFHRPDIDGGMIEALILVPGDKWRIFAPGSFTGPTTRRTGSTGVPVFGVTYDVDLRWDQNFGVVLYVDGQVVDGIVSADGGRTTPGIVNNADQLRLGIDHYDGNADAGWSVTLADFELLDEVSFPGPL